MRVTCLCLTWKDFHRGTEDSHMDLWGKELDQT